MANDMNDKPWAAWVDGFGKELLEHGIDQGLYITRNEVEDRIFSGFYNTTLEDKFVLLGHLLSDLVVDIVARNVAQINDISSDYDEDEDEYDEDEPPEDDV